jgi:hypothetical protein
MFLNNEFMCTYEPNKISAEHVLWQPSNNIARLPL